MTTTAAVAADPLTQGWFNHGQKILELVEQHRPVVCVELGSWLGASAIPVARAIRRWGGTLTCVDMWKGTVANVDGRLAEAPPWMLASCARNIIHAGVGANVRLVPATTCEAAQWWREPIDYLYVDADHSYDGVMADLEAWVPHVRPGGVILGDDYGSDMYPGVAMAWEMFASRAGWTLSYFQSDPPDRHGIQLVYVTV